MRTKSDQVSNPFARSIFFWASRHSLKSCSNSRQVLMFERELAGVDIFKKMLRQIFSCERKHVRPFLVGPLNKQ